MLLSVAIEDYDLTSVTALLHRHLTESEPPVGYLRGRSYFRDVLTHLLRCSEQESEDLVDTLELNGFLIFEGNPAEPSVAESRWRLDPHMT